MAVRTSAIETSTRSNQHSHDPHMNNVPPFQLPRTWARPLCTTNYTPARARSWGRSTYLIIQSIPCEAIEAFVTQFPPLGGSSSSLTCTGSTYCTALLLTHEVISPFYAQVAHGTIGSSQQQQHAHGMNLHAYHGLGKMQYMGEYIESNELAPSGQAFGYQSWRKSTTAAFLMRASPDR